MLFKTVNGEDKRVTLGDLIAGKTKRVNGKEVPVTIADYKKRRIWVLPPEKVSIVNQTSLKDETKVTQTRVGPASTNVLSYFEAYDKDGNSFRMRYAESSTPGNQFRPVTYQPEYITFTECGHMSVEDPEKNYFLEQNPHNGSNAPELRKGIEVQYVEYNPSANALPHISRVKDVNYITSKIFNMSTEQLKAACDLATKNMQHVNVPDMEIASDEQMQSALIILLNDSADPMGWATATLNLMDNVVLMAIKQGQINEKIKFDLSTREWEFTNPTLKTKVICKVKPGVDSEKALLDFMLSQPDTKRDILMNELSAMEPA